MDTKGTAPEAKTGAGYVYVLTNPSFPTFVKIGYADDVQERVKDLNRSSGLPFTFRIYCTLEVPAPAAPSQSPADAAPSQEQAEAGSV